MRIRLFLLVWFGGWSGGGALADTVPWGYQQMAKKQGVPAAVLYAIALTESNHKLNNGTYRPWPWTLNVRGRGHRYKTRKAAYAALVGYLRQDITLIDVGLMQVNWHYHKGQLGTPWQALEPYHNMQVGSRILRAEYAVAKDWLLASGRYHAPNNPKQARKYRKLVAKRLVQIQASIAKQ